MRSETQPYAAGYKLRWRLRPICIIIFIIARNRDIFVCNQQHTVSHCACDCFSRNFGTIKRIYPGSSSPCSSPSRREGPGTEVDRVDS